MSGIRHETVDDSNFASDQVSYQQSTKNNLTLSINISINTARTHANNCDNSHILKVFGHSDDDSLSNTLRSIAQDPILKQNLTTRSACIQSYQVNLNQFFFYGKTTNAKTNS